MDKSRAGRAIGAFGMQVLKVPKLIQRTALRPRRPSRSHPGPSCHLSRRADPGGVADRCGTPPPPESLGRRRCNNAGLPDAQIVGTARGIAHRRLLFRQAGLIPLGTGAAASGVGRGRRLIYVPTGIRQGYRQARRTLAARRSWNHCRRRTCRANGPGVEVRVAAFDEVRGSREAGPRLCSEDSAGVRSGRRRRAIRLGHRRVHAGLNRLPRLFDGRSRIDDRSRSRHVGQRDRPYLRTRSNYVGGY